MILIHIYRGKIMKKLFICLFLFTAGFIYGQGVITLNQAANDIADYLKRRFPEGTRTAITNIRCENPELGDFVHNRISLTLVNNRHLVIVERNAAALQLIDQEMERHLNNTVSQETELSIGKQLGAEMIVSGSFVRSGQNWRLEIFTMNVQTAQRTGQWSGIVRAEPSWVFPVTAFLIYSGDEFPARYKQTVLNSLRSGIQEKGLNITIDEDRSIGSGYGFNIEIHLNQGAGGFGLIQAEASVIFTRGRRELFRAGPYQITEMNEQMIARRIDERLKADETFFNRLRDQVR